MKFKFLSMLLALSVIPVTNAYANDEYETNAIMVTTGTLTEALIDDLPSTIEVISAEQIEQMNAIDARDALMKSNKVLVQGVGGGGVMIRGYGSSYTTILVNGRKPSGFGTAGSGSTANILSYIPASSIERIEVLYGSAGAMYGTNTAGGVINIITKQSYAEPSVTVRSTYGTTHWTNDLNMDFGKIGNFDARANLSHSKLHEYKDYDYDRTVIYNDDNGNGNDFWSGSYGGDSGTWSGSAIGDYFFANLEMGYDIIDGHRLSLFSDYYDRTSYSRNLSGTIDSGTGVVTPNADITTGSTSSRYKYSNALVYDGSISNHTYSLGIDMSKSVNAPLVGNYTILSTSSVYDNYGVDFKNSWFINNNNILSVGLEYNYDEANTADYAQQHAYAAFAQYELGLLDGSLLLFPFLRLDDADYHAFVASPQFGATYEFSPNQRVKANVGMGFKAPTLAEAYAVGSSGSTWTLPSTDLSPEKSLNYELSYSGDFDLAFGSLSSSVALYRTDFTDYIGSEIIYGDVTTAPQEVKDYLISQGYDPTDSTRSIAQRINIGSAYLQGAEVELGLNFLENFDLSLGYRFTDAWNNDTDSRMVGAMHSFTGSLGYTHIPWGLSASIWGKYYMDTYRTENSTRSAQYHAPFYFDYYTTGFDLGKSFVDNKYRINLSGENVLTSERCWDSYEHVTYAKYNISFATKF